MRFSLNDGGGEVEVNHQASPGLTEAQALRAEYIPDEVREGKSSRMKTLFCIHCGGHWRLNPFRTRERNYCLSCNHYICDGCKAETYSPDYEHASIHEKIEKVQSGRYTLVGDSVTTAKLVRIGG